MAILYFIKVNNPNKVPVLPPSLRDTEYFTNLASAQADAPLIGSQSTGSTIQIFSDQTALNAYASSIALTSEQQAAVSEWHTNNNISITYETYSLTASGAGSAPEIFGTGVS